MKSLGWVIVDKAGAMDRDGDVLPGRDVAQQVAAQYDVNDPQNHPHRAVEAFACEPGEAGERETGLRVELAKAAMQGMLAAGHNKPVTVTPASADALGKDAVAYADGLLRALGLAPARPLPGAGS